MLNNQLLIELLYTFIIVSSSLFIYLKTKKLYSLTTHQGIRSFRDAFFYLGLAFIIRFILFLLPSFALGTTTLYPLGLGFNLLLFYTLSMGGFSLVYSLVWKHFHQRRIILLHMVAIGISIIDVFYISKIFFIIQLVVLLYAISIMYSNYMSASTKSVFQQSYFIALILAFIGYLTNFLVDVFVVSYPFIKYYAYIITVLVFMIFAFGVWRRLKWPKKENV
ncbi:hypothetical protein CL622_01325 [archaeon]|nr:hypothetical protein [archaeon]